MVLILKKNANIDEIKNIEYFYSNLTNDYLYFNNKIDPYIPLVEPKFLIKRAHFNNAAKNNFTVDLSDYSSIDGFKGFLDFEFLYYPGLQNINISLDGQNYTNA
ncbi:MAG: hypothetical protein LBV23_10495 [Deltaproteobacteria bacterium]|nr:hypothetical protein [Deltaproteobacteria bacterium]